MTQERAPIIAPLRFRRLMMLSKESLFLTLIGCLSKLSRPGRRFGREHALLVGKTVIIWKFTVRDYWVIFVVGTFDIQVGLWPRVLLNFLLTPWFHTNTKVFHPMIILLRLSVFGAPAIVDVSPTHYLRRLLGHDLILVWEVHVRLRLVFHFVLAQDRIVHIMFDVFLRPPRPILLSLHFRVLPSYVRVAHVEHGFIHDGSAEYKLVLICNFLILFVVFSVILIG